MAENVRTKAERESQLEQIARYWVRGYTQQQIANHYKLSQGQISYDLKEVRERWKQATIESYKERVFAEVLLINEVQQTAWKEWEETFEPRFLQVVLKCSHQRSRLLGLYDMSNLSSLERSNTREQKHMMKQAQEAVKNLGLHGESQDVEEVWLKEEGFEDHT
ncbi:MAG: hypothetical protein KDD67_10135 [Ignavibacteriae bacterium]|nr:hypothetical protein [Ignavibacteriota bacterium]MCB9216623.1 hypothetical protein [Ignavibacteria bacterium]